MPRKTSPTEELARRFVTEFLGEEFDYRLHGRFLKEAKRFVNPGEDEISIPADDVWGCLQAMKHGVFDYSEKIGSLWCITFGTPPYIQQYYEWKKEPPPFYRVDEIALWKGITGQGLPQPEKSLRFVPTL